ncbi:MAG: hypothetical protein EBU08_17370, partial [Micrococcales bacterium]|nr:hypothetical protein [Micrococcales bacterium]
MYYNRNCFFGQPKSSTTKVLLFAGYKSSTLGLTVIFQESAQVPVQVGQQGLATAVEFNPG